MSILLLFALSLITMVGCSRTSNSGTAGRSPAQVALTETSIGHLVGFSVGANFISLNDVEQARELDAIAESGVTWVRLDFSWSAVQKERATYSWDKLDRATHAVKARGLKVLGLLAYTPAWARPEGTTSRHAPNDPKEFATFAASAGARYDNQVVQAWEVWNEPNISNFWQPAPDPEEYTSLLKGAARALRTARPGAVILAGALAPAEDSGARISPETFLRRMYAAGGRDSFDAISVHPYSYPELPMQPDTVFAQMSRYHAIMAENGDSYKQIWGTEWGAPTGTGPGAVSDSRQAETFVQGLRQVRSGKWPWLGPLFVYQTRDEGTNVADREENFGLLRRDFSPKPAWPALAAAVRGSASLEHGRARLTGSGAKGGTRSRTVAAVRGRGDAHAQKRHCARATGT